MNLLQIDSEIYGDNWEIIMQRMEANGIQTRPVWALNHLQKPYKDCQRYKIERAKILLVNNLCLPSSASLDEKSINQVIGTLGKIN